MAWSITIRGSCPRYKTLWVMAVLTCKWCWSNNRWRIHLVTPERCNLLNKVRVMAGNTVFRLCHIGIVVPCPIAKLNISLAVATGGQAVSDHGYSVFTVRVTHGTCRMAWETEMIPYHYGKSMVSVRYAVAMAFSATVCSLVAVHAVINTYF